MKDVGFPMTPAHDESRKLGALPSVLETTDSIFSVEDDNKPPIEHKNEKTVYVWAIDHIGTWVKAGKMHHG